MRLAAVAALASIVGLASPLSAREVNASLRQLAIDTCSGDAYRLCFGSLLDERAVVTCMSSNRASLSRSCRVVYDQVARVVRE